jgi:hypothetical protein
MNNDTWTKVDSCSGNNCFHGYGSPLTLPNYGKRWGTNFVENDQTYLGTSENDSDITVVVNGNTITNLTQYSKQNSPCGVSGSNCFEAQVISGDSGSGVYHKRNGVWELAGITSFLFQPIYGDTQPPFSLTFIDGQNATTAVYRDVAFDEGPIHNTGDLSGFVALSSYKSAINDIISLHQDYSIKGDVNLDGVLSGNGTGPASSDDVTAFMQGWRYQQSGGGSVESWKKGDLNRDGVVNVGDFLLMRSALNTAGLGASAEALGGLLGSGGVPEPSAIVLTALAAGSLALRRRRYHPRQL